MECTDKAIEIKIEPIKSVFYLNKADTLIELERYLEAISILDKTLELNSNDANIYGLKRELINNLLLTAVICIGVSHI